MAGLMLTPALFLGLFGLGGATLLCPMVARALSRNSRSAERASDPIKKIAILIPAHNEEQTLQKTLRSVLSAISFASAEYPHLEIVVAVGADGCSDKTASIAESCGVKVIEFKSRQGKWRSIEALVASYSDFDWIALVDSGTNWPKEILFKCIPLLSDRKCMAVAPTYRDTKSGKIAQTLWWLESKIKYFEMLSGGPVTAHGATVFYRVTELTTALETLKGSQWRNDDVVIPLVLRTLFPHNEIRYCLDIAVYEGNPENPSASFPRRQRVLLGNLEWMQVLFPVVCRNNHVVALLALRRVFRIFWAYWAALILLPISLLLFPFSLVVAGIISGLCVIRFVPQARTIGNAALVSLLAPFYLLNRRTAVEGRWR